MMENWAVGDEKQALPLLSGLFSCNKKYKSLRVIQDINLKQIEHFKKIRSFAVKIMKTNVSADIFELILLQLVHALRYEASCEAALESPLLNLIFERAITAKSMFNTVHWTIFCESNNTDNSSETQAWY